MAIPITPTTIPGTETLDNHGSSITMQLLGGPLGRETLPVVPNVAAIKAAVARFGAQVRAEHPGVWFYVSVLLAAGQRKPNGFDTASCGNGLGQEDFLHVTDNRTQPAVPAAPAGVFPEKARACSGSTMPSVRVAGTTPVRLHGRGRKHFLGFRSLARQTPCSDGAMTLCRPTA